MVAQPSKPKKSSKKEKTTSNPEDFELLQTEVASLASSLGFASSVPSSGFDDSDFRKKGPLKKPQKQSNKQRTDTTRDNVTAEGNKGNLAADDKRRPKPKPPVLSIDDNNAGNSAKGAAKFKNLPRLPLVKATTLGVWYEDAQQLEEKVIGEGKKLDIKNIDEWKALVEKKRELGERLMWQYAQDYEGSRGQSGDIKMLVATQRSGTAADKVSAFSVMVGDNPIANVRALDGLVGLVASKVGKRHALTGFEVLKELFVSSLIPDRKLKTLMQRPLNHLPENKDGYSLLLFWYWEECLKQRYERFIFSLEEASRDMLPVLKDKSLKTIYQLLKSKSEQERRLLSALVNKLGDPQNKGASNADFHLSNLLSEHPNMKAVVIDEVDSFLFRPHLGIRAKYHAVNFLSQIRLGHKGDGPKVAKRLIDVYFALFKVLITEAGASKKTKEWSSKKHGKKVPTAEEQTNESESHIELDSRILSALLTGVNRAFPFVSSSEADDIVEVQTPLLFKLVHSKNFNVGIQALMLLDKISSKNQIVSDRFYRALYSKLLLPAAMHSSKAEMFIGLLLRAMKNDVNLNRVAAFSKRLLQVALQLPPNYACGYLFLLSELLKARPPLWNMVQQSEAVDDEVEHFEDIKEEGDAEVETEPNKQNNGTNGDDNKETGSSEDEDDEAPVSSSDNDEDDDDVPNEDDELFIKDVSENDEDTNDSPKQRKQGSTRELLPGGYDPRHREPLYSNAHRVCWWELTVLASHVHPSVATMARTLLSGTNIVYNGNPLNDLTLTAFLEKLMEKKPKQATWHGGSQIEPAKKLEMNNHLIGPELLSLAETDVPPEDVVFHKFYLNKMNTTKKQKKKKKGRDDEDAEELFEVDGGDESDNEEISNIMDEADLSDKEDGEYDYDDLDRVGVDDDDDLVGDASDVDMDGPLDDGEDIDFDVPDDVDDVEEIDDDDVAIGDVDDGDDDGDDSMKKPKKRKSGASPFASLEEFEHLMKDDNGDDDGGGPKLKKFKKDKKFKKEKTDKKKKNKKSSK